MRWVCSEARRGATGLALLGAVALSLAAAVPVRASTWLYGVFPVPAFAGFTSGFGDRVHPLAGAVPPHHGVDIAAPPGSPVRSWRSGRVQEVIADGGCGNGLVIRSGDYEHLYCHLAGRAVGGVYSSGAVRLVRGQAVRRGQLIGHVGLSGSTTGPHLHWGVRYRGDWLDPARILRAMAASRSRILARISTPKVDSLR